MASGIYKLTFPSGKFYIGKSVDIEARWKQHWDKFTKGRHTQLMQTEFNIYGDYNREVLAYIHEDHLDIMEETLIARLNPPLNGTKGKDRMSQVYDEQFDMIVSYFDKSTLEHIVGWHNSKNMIEELQGEIEDLTETIAMLEIKRTEEELAADVLNKVNAANKLLDSCRADNTKLMVENIKLRLSLDEANKPWYKKLF